MAESEGSTSRLMFGSWHEEHGYGGNLCMVEAQFSRPVSALTLPQPVKACNLIRASHILSPNEFASFLKSMNRVRFFVPHF